MGDKLKKVPVGGIQVGKTEYYYVGGALFTKKEVKTAVARGKKLARRSGRKRKPKRKGKGKRKGGGILGGLKKRIRGRK